MRRYLAEDGYRPSPRGEQRGRQPRARGRDAPQERPVAPATRVPSARHQHCSQQAQGEQCKSERGSLPARKELFLQRWPEEPRWQRYDGGYDPRPEAVADRSGLAAGSVHEAGEIPGPGARELFDERLEPAHDQDRRPGSTEAQHASAPFGPRARIAAALGTDEEEKADDAPCAQNRDEKRVAQVGLHDEAADKGAKRESDQVPGRHRPNEDEEEEERQHRAVRVPRLEQQLTPHRPAHPGRRRHRYRAGQRATAPVRKHRDPDDAQGVDDGDAEGHAGTAPGETRWNRKKIEVQGSRMVDQAADVQRSRRPRPDEREVRVCEQVPRPDGEQRVVLGRDPAGIDRARRRDRHGKHGHEDRREKEAASETRLRWPARTLEFGRAFGLAFGLGCVFDGCVGLRARVHVSPRPRGDRRRRPPGARGPSCV